MKKQSIEKLITFLSSKDFNQSDFIKYCESKNLARDDAYNVLSIFVARHFMSGVYDFDVADYIINNIQDLIWNELRNNDGYDFPEPAFSIYSAFDAGEHDHGGDSGDPVEEYTRPLLKKLLTKDQK